MKRTAAVLTLLMMISMFAFLAACNETRKDPAARSSSTSSDQKAAQQSAQAIHAQVAFGIGLPAPDFTLTDIHGRQVTLSKHQGKAVVVDFWATWCGPCRIAMPHLQALAQQYPDQLVVLAISLDQDPKRVVPPFAAQLGLTFTLLADPKAAKVAQEWGGVSSIPTAYLVDPKGVVVEKWVGVKSRKEYEKRIKNALGLDI